MTPVRSAVSSVIAPMQKGINAIGVKISERMDYATTLKKTVRKNKKLQSQIDKLSAENKLLQQDKYELENFRKLYDLDQQYAAIRITGIIHLLLIKALKTDSKRI